MNSFLLTTSINTVANAFACKYSIEELTLLATMFVQLGDTLATIAAQKTLCRDICEKTNLKEIS